jgi:hypothetical protein
MNTTFLNSGQSGNRKGRHMKYILASLLSLAFVFGIAGSADAKSKKRYYDYNSYWSPSAIRQRQRHASTFDETQYYEHDSRKIPFGTATWWRQLEIEGSGRRR